MRDTVKALPGLAFILALLYGLYLIGAAFWRAYAGLDKTVATTLATAAATICVAVISVVVSKAYDRRQVFEREMLAKKIPVYEHLIELIFKIVVSSTSHGKNLAPRPASAPDAYSATIPPDERPLSGDELVQGMQLVGQKLLVWGSNDVVRAWTKVRLQQLDDPLQIMVNMEGLFSAIRKDLGHRKGMHQGELLKVFVNDVDEALEKILSGEIGPRREEETSPDDGDDSVA